MELGDEGVEIMVLKCIFRLWNLKWGHMSLWWIDFIVQCVKMIILASTHVHTAGARRRVSVVPWTSSIYIITVMVIFTSEWNICILSHTQLYSHINSVTLIFTLIVVVYYILSHTIIYIKSYNDILITSCSQIYINSYNHTYSQS